MPEPDENAGIPISEAPDEKPRSEHHEPMLQWFEYAHLREDLQKYSQPFGALALWITINLPRNAERTVALRKLLEAKDATIRSRVSK